MCAALFLNFKLGVRLTPAHAGSLKLFSSMKSACVFVCVCTCPQAIENHSREIKPE